VVPIESQNLELRDLKEDIKEIKASVKELAVATTTLALHTQRLDTVETRLTKLDLNVDELWEEVHGIKTTCVLREPVFKYGAKKMDHHEPSRDDWMNILIGSAVRNGIWIIGTGVMTTLILYYLGVKK
jgi:hypothetical protein